jgi:myosin heavy subunit
MSTSTDLHFIRCIKPNEEKLPFKFVERVCYNQIKYLGILDTIQMRKQSYHVRMPYNEFYLKYGIL